MAEGIVEELPRGGYAGFNIQSELPLQTALAAKGVRGGKAELHSGCPSAAHRAEITVCAFPAQPALFNIKFRGAPEILLEFVST